MPGTRLLEVCKPHSIQVLIRHRHEVHPGDRGLNQDLMVVFQVAQHVRSGFVILADARWTLKAAARDPELLVFHSKY
jgi:hypothetical protein